MSRGIAVLFLGLGTRWGEGWGVQPHAPAASTPGSHFTGGWVGPRARLEGRKNLVPTGIRSRTFQPVVSRCTE